MPSFGRVFLSYVSLFAALPAVAQMEKFLPSLKSDLSREEVVISADTFGVDQKTGWVDAKGNVKVKASDHELSADKVRLHREKGDIQASGNVVIRRTGFGTWTGDYIEYNYKTGKGLTSAGDVVAKDFRIHADEVERREDGRFDLNGLAMTTCTNEPGRWHWCVCAAPAVTATTIMSKCSIASHTCSASRSPICRGRTATSIRITAFASCPATRRAGAAT